MASNRVDLLGRLIESGGLRHTPAGIPALQIRLGHASHQEEAGRTRPVNFEMAALAFGEVAARLAEVSLGTLVQTQGFLDRTSVRNPQPQLHITEFELPEE